MARDKATRPYNSRSERASAPRARPPLGDAHLRRPFDGAGVQRALSQEPREGPDGALDRVRSAHADGLRPRSRAVARRGRQGRRIDRPQGRHARPARRHPARRDEHVDDDQRDRGLAAGPLHDGRRGERRLPERPPGHDPERHHQGVPLARHLRVPARALDAPDRGHDRVHGRRGAEVEPDQHLLVPPPGGRGHAGAGDRLRALDRRGRARPRARAGSGRVVPARVRPHVVLRQRRASASSRSTRSCARWASSGRRSGARATAWTTTGSFGSATACR